MFMAIPRRLQLLTRHASPLFSTNTTFQSLQTPPPLPIYQPLKTPTSKFPLIFNNPDPSWLQTRHFSSSRIGDVNKDNKYSEEEDDDDDDDDYVDDDDEAVGDSEDESVSGSGSKREYTAEEKEAEAAAIGYRVIGPLQKFDRVFQPYAVVQIGSHQFKVSNGDCIFTERLKFCEENDKLILNKVLMLGPSSWTVFCRPLLSHAVVHAVVEEQALDAMVIGRKNYRRTKGHCQEWTKLRIVDVRGGFISVG